MKIYHAVSPVLVVFMTACGQSSSPIAPATSPVSTPAPPTRVGTLTANPPSPIQVCGTDMGMTTLTWTTLPPVTATEVHLDAPDGTLFSAIGPSGSKATGDWVGPSRAFYLQDVSGGLPRTSANTLATLTVYTTKANCPGAGTIVATPNPVQVCDDTGLGTTALAWTSSGSVTDIEVRVGSPTGALFATNGPNGRSTTGKWVGDGMTFYLQNVTAGLPLTPPNTLATVTVRTTTAGCAR